jgi:hypothetical protein
MIIINNLDVIILLLFYLEDSGGKNKSGWIVKYVQ